MTCARGGGEPDMRPMAAAPLAQPRGEDLIGLGLAINALDDLLSINADETESAPLRRRTRRSVPAT